MLPGHSTLAELYNPGLLSSSKQSDCPFAHAILVEVNWSIMFCSECAIASKNTAMEKKTIFTTIKIAAIALAN